MPEKNWEVTLNIKISKEYQELQETLLQAGQLILKAASLIDNIKETALNKFGED
jgi:hypothetical protein